MLKRLWRQVASNPLDSLLKGALKKRNQRVLIAWNRGLGDIPLGLYAIIHRVRQWLPHAEITFLTRPDLQQGFELLSQVKILVDPAWKRGCHYDISASLTKLRLHVDDYDLVLAKPDPTYWVRWQIGTLTPKLNWKQEWDELGTKHTIEHGYVGMHVQTETQYGYEKNWPIAHWEELIQILGERYNKKVILFGLQSTEAFAFPNVLDLRGKTNLFETLSIIKNKCSHLVVPDSGILSLVYYLDVEFSLRLISLWADPRQGVLKQKVASPNSMLIHIPLIGSEDLVRNIAISSVEEALFSDER